MDFDVAEKISILMLQLNSKLDDSVAYVRDNSTQQELEVYRRAVGKIMGAILMDSEEPIFKEHPSLLPDGLGWPK